MAAHAYAWKAVIFCLRFFIFSNPNPTLRGHRTKLNRTYLNQIWKWTRKIWGTFPQNMGPKSCRFSSGFRRNRDLSANIFVKEQAIGKRKIRVPYILLNGWDSVAYFYTHPAIFVIACMCSHGVAKRESAKLRHMFGNRPDLKCTSRIWGCLP